MSQPTNLELLIAQFIWGKMRELPQIDYLRLSQCFACDLFQTPWWEDKRQQIIWDDVAKTWVHRKKPYTKPKLTMYGNIRDMTETSNMGNKLDAHHRRSLHKTA